MKFLFQNFFFNAKPFLNQEIVFSTDKLLDIQGQTKKYDFLNFPA